MPDETKATPQPTLETYHAWLEIWLAALTRPSVATYEKLIRQPGATAKQAVIWIIASGLISGVAGVVTPLFSQLSRREPIDAALLLGVPAIAVVAALYWSIFAACTQWAARLLRGAGTYQTLAYAFAAFSAPLTIAASLLALIPRSGILLFGLYLYWLVLYAVATRSVHRFSLAKAVGSVLISVLLLAAVILGTAFLMVSLGRRL